MRRLTKFFRFTAERRALLIAAAGLLVAIRIALALMPLRQLRNLLAWRPRQKSATRAGEYIERCQELMGAAVADRLATNKVAIY